MEIYEIHERAFEYCYDQHFSTLNIGGALTFALRKSNRYDRLLHGHWFYGNENYVAISFWAGSDWKNKTPNIFFGIDKSGGTFLEITASDSTKKHLFLRDNIAKVIPGMYPYRSGWRKEYSAFDDDYMESLKSFMQFEKLFIDNAIRNESKNYFTDEEKIFNRIDFIESNDFERRLKNVLRYRRDFDPKNIRKRLPEHLKGLRLKMSYPKINVSFEKLPNNAQWIFFTGLNGTGKTNILRGITVGVYDNFDNAYLFSDPTFEIDIRIAKNRSSNRRVTNLKNTKKPRKRMTNGFAAYGSSRLNILESEDGTTINESEVIGKTGMSYSLFKNDGYLFSIDPIFFVDDKNSLFDGEPHIFSRFMDMIVDVLPDIVPNLISIKVPTKATVFELWSLIEYVEADEKGEAFPPVQFEDLSSGSKSMVAMFGDMLIRLFSQQPEVEDFSELTGIVLIDEIDVHLHPTNQRIIVEKLTGIFPKIQFIVSTHSPVPLLGAPKNSVFFRVERSAEHGVTVSRLKQLETEIENLLPNTLYTSDLFNLEIIVSAQNTTMENIDTSNTYEEFKEDERLAKNIKRLKTNPDDAFLNFLQNEKS